MGKFNEKNQNNFPKLMMKKQNGNSHCVMTNLTKKIKKAKYKVITNGGKV